MMIQLIKVGNTANYTAKIIIKLISLDDSLAYYVLGDADHALVNFFRSESSNLLVFEQEHSRFYIQKSHIQWAEVVKKEAHDQWRETLRSR